MSKLKEFIKECRRVWIVTKKPTKDEYNSIVKITGLGILAIGLLGFIINLIAGSFL